MIPLGILASGRHASAGVLPTFRQVSAPTNSAGVSTVTAANIGPASANRTIIVAAMSWSGGSRSINGVTIGGVSATLDALATGRPGPSAIASLNVPTGTTADIVVTSSDSTPAFSVAVWTVDSILTVASTAVPAFYASGTTAMSLTLPQTSADGFAIAAHRSRASARTTTWAGVTEDYDSGAAQPYSGASGATTGAALDITATFSVATDNTTTVLAVAYDPA